MFLRRLALATAFALGLAASAWADFKGGFSAYLRDDYATALGGFRPLASQGHAPAQQLERPPRRAAAAGTLPAGVGALNWRVPGRTTELDPRR